MTKLATSFSPPPSQLPRTSSRPRLRKFTVDEYHKMIESGVFSGNENFELLEGWVVEQMSRTPPHDVAIDKSGDAIRERVPPGWRVRVQSAITTDDSEPEPDLAVVLGPADRYRVAHPRPADIAMIVESAASSLELDRADKGRVYAAAHIAVYWILNVVDNRVEVYTNPEGTGAAASYRTLQLYAGDEVVPLFIAGKNIAGVPARELLP